MSLESKVRKSKVGKFIMELRLISLAMILLCGSILYEVWFGDYVIDNNELAILIAGFWYMSMTRKT